MQSMQSINPAFEGLTLADLAGIVYTFGGTGMDMPDFKEALEDEYASRMMMLYGKWKRAQRADGNAPDAAPAYIPPPTHTPTHTPTPTPHTTHDTPTPTHTPTQPTDIEIPPPPPPMEME